MLRHNRLWRILLAFLIFLPNASAQSQELVAPTGAVPEVWKADLLYGRHCLVRYDTTLLPPTEVLLQASLSDALIRRALTASGVTDSKSQSLYHGWSFFTLEGMPSGTRFCQLGFKCRKDAAPQLLLKIWKAVVAELEKSWKKSQNAALAVRDERQNEARHRLDRQFLLSEDQLDDVTDKYIQLQIDTLTTSAALRQELHSTVASRRAIALNIRSLEARREAVQKRIDWRRQRPDSQTERTAIWQQLAQIVLIREEALAQTVARYKAGTAPATAVAAAREALARAKVELIRAQIEQSPSAAKELHSLNESVAQMGIDLAEKKATLVATLQQIDELSVEFAKQLQAEKELDRTKLRLDLLQEQVHTLAQRRAELDSLDQFVQPVSITPWGE